MMRCRSQTSMQRGLGKVRKARAVVVILLCTVAATIVFIDKKEEKQQVERKNIEIATTSTGESIDMRLPSGITLSREETVRPHILQTEAIDSQPAPHTTQETGQLGVVSPERSILPDARVNVKSKSAENAALQNGVRNEKQAINVHGKQDKLDAKADDNPKTATHTIAAGDSFSSVAQRYYGSSKFGSLLQKANSGLNPKNLKLGQKIVLPEKKALEQMLAKSETSRTSPRANKPSKHFVVAATGKNEVVVAPAKKDGVYVAGKNETLKGIAKRMGVNFLRLYECNQDVLGRDPDYIKAGTQIRIPMAMNK